MIIITNYRLSFADQGKQTSVCRFRQEQTNGKCRFQFFPFFVCVGMCVFMYVYIYKYIYLYSHLNFYATVSNVKRKMKAQAIFLNPFTVCSSCKRKLVFFRSLTKKQMEVICLQSTTVNGLDGLSVVIINLIVYIAVFPFLWKAFSLQYFSL
jgi:hypothetical protein